MAIQDGPPTGFLTILILTLTHLNQETLVIVHNGIIENYDTLRKELINRGYTFQSDTDTEVLVNLIEEVKKQENCKLGKAVQISS